VCKNVVIEMLKVWLKKRFYNVSIYGENSPMFDLLLGTVQGSILGSILYLNFVAPLFDLEYLKGFTDDMFIPRVGSNLNTHIYEMEQSLKTIIVKSGTCHL
jgi:hypothetical protein